MGLENLQDTLRQLAQKGTESPYETSAPRSNRKRRKMSMATPYPEELQTSVQLSLFQNH